MPTAELSRRHDETSIGGNNADRSGPQLKRAGQRAGLVMVAAESSYVACGNFFDVEEGIAGQYHLETRRCGLCGVKINMPEHRREHWRRLAGVQCEVCQGAHMKSFSWFCRRVYVVLGSLGEHRCSRITDTVGD